MPICKWEMACTKTYSVALFVKVNNWGQPKCLSGGYISYVYYKASIRHYIT